MPAAAAARNIAGKKGPAGPRQWAGPKRPPKKPAAKAAPKAKAKGPTAQQRNSAFATKQHGIRQQQSVNAFGAKQQHRVASASQIHQDAASIRIAEREYNASQAAKARRRASVNKAFIGAAKAPFEPHDTISAPRNSVVNPILLIILTWAGIVIMYAMITSPSSSEGFFNSMRNWVGLLYQTKPMFTTDKVTGA